MPALRQFYIFLRSIPDLLSFQRSAFQNDAFQNAQNEKSITPTVRGGGMKVRI